MRVKGHKLRLDHNGERARDESGWTASCLCGWQESTNTKSEAQNEYAYHLLWVVDRLERERHS